MKYINLLFTLALTLPAFGEDLQKGTRETRLEELRRMRDEYFRLHNSGQTPAVEVEQKTNAKPAAPTSSMERAALAYLLADGWKRYACRIVKRDFKDMLVVSDGLSTWITEAPILFSPFCRECIGKGGVISGPNDIISDDGKHHKLILPDWKELH